MEEKEWEMLFKANAKLNSPEMRTIREEAEKYQQLCNGENQPIEPIEAMIHTPYTETAEFVEEIQKIDQMGKALQEIRNIQESERQARIAAESRTELAEQKQIRENRIWQATAVTIGLLTLAATIVFGILALLH